MAVIDKVVGTAMLLAAAVIFAYYTAWVVVTPFLGAEDPLLAYFPDRYYAVALPAVLLVAGVTLVMAFVGVVMMKTAAKKAKKAADSKKDA